MLTASQFIFTELGAANSKAFDGLSPLDNARDMHGRAVTIKADELPIYLSNTLQALEGTRGESGEIVGLPIDARGHDKGDGAGWIVGLSHEGELLRFTPNWTDIGRDLITRNIRRFFSPTVDLENKVILGGTLTNWPASRNRQGKILLRPIELSQSNTLRQLAEDSLDAKTSKVRQAFYDAMERPSMEAPYIREVFEGYVIVCAGDALYKVSYSEDSDGAVTFAPKDAWQEVKQSYIEAAFDFIKGLFTQRGLPADTQPAQNGKDEPMTIKLSELSETDRAELARLVAAQLPNGVTTTTPVIVPANENQTVDLTAIFNLAGITEDGKKQVQNWATKQAELVQQQVQMAQAQALAEVQRDNRFTELAQRLTGGTQEAPRGLKGVTADELKKHLKALPADEAKFFGDLLTGVVQNGLVEFSEIGHGKKLTGTVPLPAEFAEALDSGALKISDLSGALAGLGDLAQYDLSKWSK